MPRQLHLRHHRHVALRCVRNDVGDVLLGVSAAVNRAVRFGSEAAHLAEFGVSLNGQTPSLVFRQVPMQHIHLLQRQGIDHVFDERRGHEVPTTVEQQSPVGEVRAVPDGHGRKLKPLWAALFTYRRHQLPKRRPGAKGALGVLSLRHDAVVFHRQGVAFRAKRLFRLGPQHVRVCRTGSQPSQAGVGQPSLHGLHAPMLWPGHLQCVARSETPSLAVFATKFQRGRHGHES